MVDTSKCPCGNDKHYKDCCEKFHQGEASPETAEILMRSRFSAYVKKNKNYLLETWHSSSRPKPEELEFEGPMGFRWTHLTVVKTEEGKESDDKGKVEFVAHYKVGPKAGQMQEDSNFVKENGKWYYC